MLIQNLIAYFVLSVSLSSCIYVNQLYGMTETTFGIVKDLDSIKSKPKPGSCGYPIPGCKVKVILPYSIIKIIITNSRL